MKDLAPMIWRQRLIIEGYPGFIIKDHHINQYLQELCSLLEMVQLTDPVTHRSDKFGWAGRMHWETSGVHFYAREQPILFFSVDIYTCKIFDNQDAIQFTERFFNTQKIVYKSC